MGIKWNPDFNRNEHKELTVVNSQALLRKTGAITYVKPLKKRRPTFVEGVKTQGTLQTSATRDFVFPGALVKIVGPSRRYYNSKFCTVISEAQNYNTSETVRYGKWWDCILPDGRTVTINSADMRPIEVQNGNIEPSDEDEE